jgi:hypothetical protein
MSFVRGVCAFGLGRNAIMKWRFAWATLVLALLSAPCIAQGVLTINLPANDLAFNTQTGMLYAAVPSSAGAPYGNSLVEISPDDGSITRSVFVGSEPFTIGMSPDAAVAYVGLYGAPLVYPVDLTTMSTGAYFTMGDTMYYGPRYANQMVVMAGAPGTVAISTRDHGFSPSFTGLYIFDNGVARPSADTSFTGGNTIAFGAQTDTLYGYTNESSSFTLERLAVNASGVTIADKVDDAIYGYDLKIISRGDTLYATSGALVDGKLLLRLGTYTLPGSGYAQAMIVDDATSSVVFAVSDKIYAYDRATFLPVKTTSGLPNGFSPTAAANCGRPACIAVANYQAAPIVIVSDVRDIFADGFGD